jgi:hypothetical protein
MLCKTQEEDLAKATSRHQGISAHGRIPTSRGNNKLILWISMDPEAANLKRIYMMEATSGHDIVTLMWIVICITRPDPKIGSDGLEYAMDVDVMSLISRRCVEPLDATTISLMRTLELLSLLSHIQPTTQPLWKELNRNSRNMGVKCDGIVRSSMRRRPTS